MGPRSGILSLRLPVKSSLGNLHTKTASGIDGSSAFLVRGQPRFASRDSYAESKGRAGNGSTGRDGSGCACRNLTGRRGVLRPRPADDCGDLDPGACVGAAGLSIAGRRCRQTGRNIIELMIA